MHIYICATVYFAQNYCVPHSVPSNRSFYPSNKVVHHCTFFTSIMHSGCNSILSIGQEKINSIFPNLLTNNAEQISIVEGYF